MATRKGEGGSAGLGEGTSGRSGASQPARQETGASPKFAIRGRPPRLAHLLPGRDHNKRRARGAIPDEALILRRARPGTGLSNPAGGSAGENRKRNPSACPIPNGCRRDPDRHLDRPSS